MSRVIWTTGAASSLRRIYHFLAAKDVALAKRALRAIHAEAGVLISHPHLGHPLDAVVPPRREWLIRFGTSGYVLQYLVENGDIYILALRHQREKG